MNPAQRRLAEKIKFNEQALVETANVLKECQANGRNIFADVPQSCDFTLPPDMERGGIAHQVYLMDLTVMDIHMNSDSLHGKAIELYQKKPEFFDPKTMYDADKDKLKVVTVGKKRVPKKDSPYPESVPAFEEESETGDEVAIEPPPEAVIENGDVTVKKKRKPFQVLVAPTIDQIINKELGCGFHQQLSGKIYENYRKLVMTYDGKPEKIFDGVTNYRTAISRLDVGRPSQYASLKKLNYSLPRFEGFGPGKTAPLLIGKYVKEGIIKNFDRKTVPVPMDRWELNISIRRGITDISDIKEKIRKDDYIAVLQELYTEALIRHNEDPIDFHHNLWVLGSEGCVYVGCKNKVNSKGDKICPFPPCTKTMDIEAYQNDGIIKISDFNIL